MKILTLLFSLTAFSLTFSQNNSFVSEIRASKYSKIPAYIRLAEQADIKVDQAFIWLSEKYHLPVGTSFVIVNSLLDDLGMRHDRYQQLVNGIEVKNAIWILHSKNDEVVSMNGLIYDRIDNLNFLISESQGLEFALNFVNADEYKWQSSSDEAFIKQLTNDPNASYFPNGKRVFFETLNDQKREFRPAYQFTIYAKSILYRATITVDAETGEILDEENLIHDADVVGSANTAYSGTRQITTDNSLGQFRLRESERGNGINTFNLNQGTDYFSATDFIDSDNNWTFTNGDLDQYATDAHFGAEMTYDYFSLEHNRNSIDGLGFELNSYVHFDFEFVNAFWDGSVMTYGDGDSETPPLTSLDVVGHEITHGLTTFTANLIYAGESGALNESFSDIFGTAVENYARPGQWDWLMGGDWGDPFRSMQNPNLYDCPDTYLGDFWDFAEEVHTNSGVQNHWFYLLTEGGSGTNDNNDAYSVTGLGIEDAAKIAFRNLTVYLTPNSDFEDARFYSMVAASDLFGGCTPEVEATADAWYAVGVGEVYTPVAVANFGSSSTSSCEAPFSVSFQNQSLNGVSYTWNFGDGATSNDINPVHSYSEYGLFTVSLTVNGGVCGNDAHTEIDYIQVDSTISCEILMPTNGLINVSTCSGTVVDSGGANGPYSDQETSTIVIAPVGADAVTIEFNVFDLEPGAFDCDYDNLRVFDGPSVSSPLIGIFCNENPPPPTITSSSGSITIRFISDWSVVDNGFSISWDCTAMSTDELMIQSFAVYPNPAKEVIYLNSSSKIAQVEITDLSGRTVLINSNLNEQNEVSITSIGENGVYFIIGKSPDGEIIGQGKFLKMD